MSLENMSINGLNNIKKRDIYDKNSVKIMWTQQDCARPNIWMLKRRDFWAGVKDSRRKKKQRCTFSSGTIRIIPIKRKMIENILSS